ncbi:MAG: choice-of-anchor J domain-containing protein [Bacteroidales bacterium]
MKKKLLRMLFAMLLLVALKPAMADNPFFEDFEGETFPPTGWASYSQLDNTAIWELNLWQNHTPGGTQSAYHNGTSGSLPVDNWLVTPQLTITDNGFHYLSFWSFLANSWSYKSNTVLVSTGSPDPADNDYVVVWNNASDLGNAWLWMNYFVNLQSYIGQDIYIAFRYEGDPWGHTWNVDDVSLIDDSPIFNISTTAVSQAVGSNGTGNQTFQISNVGIQDLTFDIEVDYLNGEGWLVVNPLNGTIASQASVDVSLGFNAAGLDFGIYQANLTITSNDTENPTATVQVTFEVVDVNVYPFTENFDSEIFPPIGWTLYDIDADGTEWALSWFNHTPGGQHAAIHNYAWDPQDGWLITPQISIPEEGFFYLSFWSMVGDADYYDKNSVLISTGSGNPADEDFVEVWVEENVSENWKQHFVNLEAFAGQDVFIAFRYEGEFAHYWVIDDVSLGEEVDDAPIMVVNATEITQVVGEDGSGIKTFKVINDGIQNLTFDLEVTYANGDGWLSASPMNGSIPAKSSQTITLSFDAAGLALGEYQATIEISGNDTENPAATVIANLIVMEAQPVDFTVIYPEYTVPTRISTDGKYVSGSRFGGLAGYLWTRFEGRIDIQGNVSGVSDDGVVAGTYDTEFEHNGIPVQTAGRWNKTTQEWEFLGMNPEFPEIFGESYNSAWGISADGSTIVGLQFTESWSAKAFKWTEADGYELIGPTEGSSRASGISADGSVIYGWAAPAWTWLPVVWHNDEMIFMDETQSNFGETTTASANGNYAAGYYGGYGFIWSPTEGVTQFENTLNMGSMSPTAVLDDGTVFGYTTEGWPPFPDSRRVFVRHPDGSMETFNEYVASRGWFDAADWTFFMVMDVTPDGNKFVGAAELPNGDWISFLLDLNPGTPEITVNPLSLTESLEQDATSTQTIAVENAGTGTLLYSALIQYTLEEPQVRQVPVGEEVHSGEIELARKETSPKLNTAGKPESRGTVLNYDGDNFDAIGLIAGGTFYGAARFPSELTSVFEDYQLESVEVYIDAVPTEMKLVIWDAGTTTSPGSLLHEQTFVPTGASWNTIDLTTPLTIRGADIWVGFQVTHASGVYVLGIDGGPADLNGGWISMDAVEWERLADYGLNSNWNIRANLSFNGMDWLSIDPRQGILDEGESGEITVTFDTAGLENGVYYANIRISSNDASAPLLIIPVTLVVEASDLSVSDVWESSVRVYPNPAVNQISVEAEVELRRIEMLSLTGQSVLVQNFNNRLGVLDISSLPPGVYLLRVISADGKAYITKVVVAQ